jgi:hypothetical protein
MCGKTACFGIVPIRRSQDLWKKPPANEGHINTSDHLVSGRESRTLHRRRQIITLPRDFQYARNSAVITAQTCGCLRLLGPYCSSRRDRNLSWALREQISSGSPSTFRAGTLPRSFLSTLCLPQNCRLTGTARNFITAMRLDSRSQPGLTAPAPPRAGPERCPLSGRQS